MNWIGGARYRVKVGGERKIQQEFFEKQKLRSTASKLTSKKKKQGSQDLVALYALNRIHTGTVNSTQSRIKRVNLDKFHSCTRRIDEVDMGSCSPSETPSKLIQSKRNSNSSTTNTTEFCKPGDVSVISSKSSKSKSRKDNLEYSIPKQKSSQEEIKEKNGSYYSPRNEGKVNKADVVVESSTNNNIMYECPEAKDMETKRKFDMFVSEDFQTTPLISYKKTKHLSKKHNPARRKDHGIRLSQDNMVSMTNDDTFLFKEKPLINTESHVTSTPVSVGNSIKCKQNLKMLNNISPIFKDYSNCKPSNNNFKPDLIYTCTSYDTTQMKKYDLPNLTENVFIKSSNQEGTISPLHVASQSSDKFVNIYDNDKIQDNCLHIPAYQSQVQTSSCKSKDVLSPVKTNSFIGRTREHHSFHSERPFVNKSEKSILELPIVKYDESVALLPKNCIDMSRHKPDNWTDDMKYQQTPSHNNLSMIKDLYSGMSSERLHFSSNNYVQASNRDDLLSEMKDLDDLSYNSDIILDENILNEEKHHQTETSKTRSQELEFVTEMEDKYLPSSNEYHQLHTMNPGQIDDNTQIEYDSPVCHGILHSEEENTYKNTDILNDDTRDKSYSYQNTINRNSYVNGNTSEKSLQNSGHDDIYIDKDQSCDNTAVDSFHVSVSMPQTEIKSVSLPIKEMKYISQPQIEMKSVSQPQIEMKSVTPPQVEIKSVSPPQVEMKYVSSPQVEIKSVSQPQIEMKSVTPPQVEIKSVSPPQVEMKYVSSPQVEIKSVSPPQAEMKSVSQPQVEMKSVSPPQLEMESNKEFESLKFNHKVEMNTYTRSKAESKSVYQQTDHVCQCMAVRTVPKLSNLCLMKMVKLWWNFSLNICEKMKC